MATDDTETAGFCERTDAGWVAVYPDPEDETLLVQIDGTTTAEVTDDAWWAGEDWFDSDHV